MDTRVVRMGEATGVYIGRPGPWGNPYLIGADGDRNEVIRKYKAWLWDRIKSGQQSLEELAALRGQTLVCYCAPQPCHGDILSAAADWAQLELDRRDECPACTEPDRYDDHLHTTIKETS